MGMDPNATSNPLLSLVGGSATAVGSILWRKPNSSSTGGANSGWQFRIIADMNTNYMGFNCYSGESFRIDGSVANNTILVGTTTSQSAYKLYVNGAAWANSLTASGTIATAGSLGAGTTSPGSSLHVAGASASTYTTAGVHIGILGTIPAPLSNPRITLVTSLSTRSGVLNWSKAGYTNSQFDFQILADQYYNYVI